MREHQLFIYYRWTVDLYVNETKEKIFICHPIFSDERTKANPQTAQLSTGT